MNRRYIITLVGHIAGIAILSIGSWQAYHTGLYFSGTTLIILLTALSYSLYRIQTRQLHFFSTLTDAVKHEDLSLSIRAPFSDPRIQRKAEELSEALKDLHQKLLDKEVKVKYYSELLDKVDTAILIIDKEGSIEWDNQAARQLLNGQSVLPEKLMVALQSHKHVISLPDPTTQSADWAIDAIRVYLQGMERWLVTLKYIHSAIEDTETEAWQKLARVLTHEIMNSITPIISLAETLDECCTDSQRQDAIRPGLQVIHQRGQRLLKFVENYRKLTHLPRPEIEEIDVLSFLSDLQRLFPDEKYIFQPPTDTFYIHADRTQMEQLFINLLKNAAEACTQIPNPKVEMSVTATHGRIYFTISDNGEGIRPEVTERIFVPFFTTKPNGSGIGLSLCRQIVLFHGGQISVRSAVGQGSQFTVSLSLFFH